MRRSERIYIGVFLLFAAAFCWGLYLVLQIPLLSGQAYAQYSTYRSDPLGLSVLYNALGATRGVQPSRNEHSLMQLGDGTGTTFFLAGVPDSDDFRLVVEAVEHFVQSGGRLVITYEPDLWYSGRLHEDSEENPDRKEEDKSREEIRREKRREAREKAEKKRGESRMAELMVNISERWDFKLGGEKLPTATEDSSGTIEVLREEGVDAQLPPALLWRSAAFFEKQADYWKVLYQRDGHPVVMEREWDQGSIVLTTDTYFLSNEAMLRHRYPALIAWMLGPNAHIIFDETHLGISRDPGIVGLMRRYRLTPLMIGFAIVALLFIWKSGVSLVPKQPLRQMDGKATEAGKSAAAGLNNLLRRSTPRDALIAACIQAWRQDYARKRPISAEVEGHMRRLEGEAAPPERLYNEIASMLKERERK